MSARRIGVVGAGILGLATARELALNRHGAEVTVLDKEPRLAAHQTGRNSGVVHAGIYYAPRSLKAELCRAGVELLRAYCREHGLAYDEVGKLVVATSEVELTGLQAILERATANGVPGVELVDRNEMRRIEPHVEGVAAVHSPHTAITDFAAVATRLADDVTEAGGRLLLSHDVTAVTERAGEVVVSAGGKELVFDALVVCAGLGTNRMARLTGGDARLRIIPFRGEYHRLVGVARDLVRGLIYPVPDPRYPFLGVHLTRRVDGEVLVGPNAVLATALEGYRWRDVSAADLRDIATWPGTWRLGARHWRTGLSEVRRSLSARAFRREAQKYVPEIGPGDMEPSHSGVRAQAVDRTGALVDDFAIDVRDGVVVVRNAPSPGATSSLAIARHVAALVPERG